MYKFLIILLAFTQVFSEEITFNISDYDITSESVKSKDENYFPLFHNSYEIPSKIEYYTENSDNLPQKIEILNYKKEFILKSSNLLKVTDEDTEKFDNFIVRIVGSGFKGEEAIYGVQTSPFIVSNDSLFFVNSVKYKTSYSRKINDKKRVVDGENLLIITKSNFLDIFDDYTEFKTQNGIDAQIITVESIVSAYQGNNTAEKIRNCIKYFYSNYGTKYVILGGGYEIIPTVVANPLPGFNLISTDLFYSNLDGEADLNGNGLYCEHDDNFDLYPDVLIGRLPGNNREELLAIVDKNKRYLNETISNREDYYKSILILGFDLFSPGDTEVYCNIISDVMPLNFNKDRLYEDSYPNFSYDTVSTYMNKGYNFIYSQSHGSHHKIGQDMGFTIQADDMYYLDSPIGLLLPVACYPGDISYPGFSNKAMISPNGGTVTYLGSTTTDYPSVSFQFTKRFLRNIVDGLCSSEALLNARILGLGNIGGQSLSRYVYFAYNFQGDPSLSYFTNTPFVPELEEVSLVTSGYGKIDGRLNNFDLESLTLVLSYGSEIISNKTISNNNFTINYTNLETDSVTLSVFGRNCLYRKWTIPVVDNNINNVAINNFELNDFNLSGVVEAGEDFYFTSNIVVDNVVSFDSISVKLGCNSDLFSYTEIFKYPLNSSNFNINSDTLNYLHSIVSKDTTVSFNVSVDLFSETSFNKVSEKSIDVELVTPEVMLSFLRYDGNNIKPVISNNSNGLIDSLSIQFNNTIGDEEVIVYNFMPNSILADSISFFSYPTAPYYISLKINDNEPIEYGPLKKIETINYEDNFSVINYPDKVIVDFSEEYNDSLSYNIYNSKNTNIPLNLTPIISDRYELSDYDVDSIKVGVIYGNEEIYISNSYSCRSPQLMSNTPLKFSSFIPDMPRIHDNKLYSSSMNSAVSVLDLNSSPWQSETIYNPIPVPFSNDFQRGYAMGNTDFDDNIELVNLTFSYGDSIRVNLIDTELGYLEDYINLYGHYYDTAPVIANIDYDSKSEILIPLFNGNITGEPKGNYLYALKYTESGLEVVDGFPLFFEGTGYYIKSPSVYDYTGDGIPEIILSSDNKIIIYDTVFSQVLTSVVCDRNIVAGIILCDVNLDNTPEIISICEDGNGVKLYVHAFYNSQLVELIGFEDGKLLEFSGYSFYNHVPAPIVADIDNNGDIEIIAVTGKKLYVFNHDGTNFSFFPVDLETESGVDNITTPSIADVDGDNVSDIIFLSEGGYLNCVSGSNGYNISGFPIKLPTFDTRFNGSLPVSDVDNDGDIEIFTLNDTGNLLVFDISNYVGNRKIIDKYRADISNTGYFSTEQLVGIEDDEVIPESIELLGNYPNPFNPSTVISFRLKEVGDVRFTVFNVLGETVYNKKMEHLSKGIHKINYSTLDLSSGIYIYSIKHNNAVRYGKMTLIK